MLAAMPFFNFTRSNTITMKQFFLILLSFTSFTIIAQELKRCGSSEAQKKLFEKYPELYKQRQLKETELKIKNYERSKEGYKLSPKKQSIYKIPVVFHIIHNYGPENISDEQIKDQMRILNEDFRKQNADTSEITPAFKQLAGDAEIEFVLANIDPDGNCTNGIERIATDIQFTDDEDAKLNPWPMEQYLNIWTVGKMVWPGVAGYAYYPGTAPPGKDGIIMLSDYVGSIGTGTYSKARVLTHEAGHWLNLAHVWGDDEIGQWCGDDGVADTPETMGWTSCNLSSNDVCNPAIEENVQNYMEYAYCMRMFTQDQCMRMQDALTDPWGVRYTLWDPANLTATGVDIQPPNECSPYPEFKANYTTICRGDSISFTDHSWNATPTFWNWEFTGPVTYTSTSQNPIIKFNEPGIYNATLTTGNSAGSNSVTEYSFITVNSTLAKFIAPYTEGFELSTALSDWQILSGSLPEWERTATAKYSGSSSLILTNSQSSVGETDELISSSIDLTKLSTPKIYFRRAFAQKDSWNDDELKIYYSFNCGRTWSLRKTISGSSLATAPSQYSSFVPSASQWALDSISIPTLYATSNFKVKFLFNAGGGNNIFLDDININGILITGFDNINNSRLSLSVSPNPLEENSTISFSLMKKQNVSLKLVDLIGRTVSNIKDEEMSLGNHQIKLDHSSLRAGVYFVNLSIENQRFVQKVIVK